MPELLRTPFYSVQLALKAKMVPFAGGEMPVMYNGIIEEHHLVRSKAGLFDTSHMGEIEIEGRESFKLIQRLITNDISRLSINQAMYSPMCEDDGGIIDDIIVYRLGEERFMLVVNASNVDKDYQWIVNQAEGLKVNLKNISPQTALLALQGPESGQILQKLLKLNLAPLKYYWFRKEDILGIPAIISRTGYTGELGYEIFITDAPPDRLIELWNLLMEKGRYFGLGPCGLGARDTLRLEMKYALYGNDIDSSTNPLEAGLQWTVKFQKGDFNGRKALLKIQEKGLKRKLVGFEMLDRGIARHGYDILKNGKKVGQVTSGSFSPSLGKGIGLGYVGIKSADIDTEIDIDIREKKYKARIITPPFYKSKDKVKEE
ncbi:MAG: glycine cleavage system aminomethyltransferase GcvT [bacterium]